MITPTENLQNIKEKFYAHSKQMLAMRNQQGYWEGALSSSALGVAVSIIAFHLYSPKELGKRIEQGIHWLVANKNSDGGFGDTSNSPSNISTSLLCYASLYIARENHPHSVTTLSGLSKYLSKHGINVESGEIAQNVLSYYKKDLTFSVPILATCAICGIPSQKTFDPIPQLPFELALLPRGFYRMLNLHVVSYAIPALIAIGVAIFRNKPSIGVVRLLRNWAIPKALNTLQKLMPSSGGFLEAIPLTAFVSLSLINAGYSNHKVVTSGISFLKRTQRNDGSWPIDVDLSTWVTTLAIKSLRGYSSKLIPPGEIEVLSNHLISIQNKKVHPFNGSRPGGWGWTHHTGSVPDCDDTPGAIIALLFLNENLNARVAESVVSGCNWIVDLQNRDGGFPTFSKGWGKLPFDRSCPDLTGHAILALSMALERLYRGLNSKQVKIYCNALEKAIAYLETNQFNNGSWLPLWFGNQSHTLKHSPVYGTARICAYLKDSLKHGLLTSNSKKRISAMLTPANKYLSTAQNSDGSWGGDKGLEGTIEETALGVSALAGKSFASECSKALSWLEANQVQHAAPIGLYFASLWYHELMYPITFYNEALARVLEENG